MMWLIVICIRKSDLNIFKLESMLYELNYSILVNSGWVLEESLLSICLVYSTTVQSGL